MFYMLYGSSLDVCFPELKPFSFRGMHSIWIIEEEILALIAPLQFVLVGFFPNHLDSIWKFFFNLKLNANLSATLLNLSHILIKLMNDLYNSRVFAHRYYFINNCYMKLTKWSPLIDFGVKSLDISIWISFPNLRPILFSLCILHALGSYLGFH